MMTITELEDRLKNDTGESWFEYYTRLLTQAKQELLELKKQPLPLPKAKEIDIWLDGLASGLAILTALKLRYQSDRFVAWTE